MATKKTPTRKTSARKTASTKKSTTKKASTKKATTKKAPAGKAPAARATSKKAGSDKSPARGSSGGAKRSGAKASPGVGGAPLNAPVVVSREIGGRTLTLETGRMAKLADGAIVARYGDTMVLASAQADSRDREDIDFFPLTVDYREKAAAAGKFPGGFFKREGRPTTREILTCRIIDRSIRPLFADGFKRETQVLSQVLATDKDNDSDIVAAIASFAALAISSIPNGQTLGACRIGMIDGKLKINPTWSDLQSKDNKLNLTVSAHRDAIVMVEAGADQVSEEVVLEALELAHEVCTEIVEMIDELVERAGKAKLEMKALAKDPEHEKLAKAIDKKFGDQLRAAPVGGGAKADRGAAMSEAKAAVKAAFPAPADLSDKQKDAWSKAVSEICGKLIKQGERESILDGRRADGRGHTDIRPIEVEVGLLPRVHGSSLFTRGETQALCIATLGTVDDQQFIDGIYPEDKKRWLLHYNFPPFSVGEVRRTGSPGRREIGHGALAERAVEQVLPTADEFAYTLRVTSEILESNGSSSMATVCGATLALMDAGVPIQQPVAGIAMGLVVEGDEIAILSDILGSEDHCGDMDFKVAGTGKGITALQMDIKCEGLTRETLQTALEQARQGRLHILRNMLTVIRKPREKVSNHAPRLESFTIPADKIGALIGPGGRTIRAMQEEFECRIAVMDEGRVEVCGPDGPKVEACIQRIQDMTAEVELDKVYKGRVTSVKEFGAFVEILPGQEGLVHVSELSNTFIRSVTDAVSVGDEIEVKVIDIDDFGKVKLSRRALLPAAEEGEREGGDDRPRGRRDREGRDRDDRRDRDERRGRDRDDRGRGRDRDDRGRDDRGRGRGPRRDEPEVVEAEIDEFEPEVDAEEVSLEDDVEVVEESQPRRRQRRERGDGERGPRRGSRDDEDRPRRHRHADEDGDARPRGRGRRDDEDRPARDDDDRPRSRRSRDRDEERPARDEDDRPRSRRRHRDDDERPGHDEDDRPRSRRHRDDGVRPARDDDERPARDEGDRPARGGRRSFRDRDGAEDDRSRRGRHAERDDEPRDRGGRRSRRDDDGDRGGDSFGGEEIVAPRFGADEGDDDRPRRRRRRRRD